MGPEREILEHHSDTPFLWRNEIPSGACDNSIRDPNLAFFGNFQTGDKAQNGGFARTGRPEKNEALRFLNPKR
jgi:hypothetical protein